MPSTSATTAFVSVVGAGPPTGQPCGGGGGGPGYGWYGFIARFGPEDIASSRGVPRPRAPDGVDVHAGLLDELARGRVVAVGEVLGRAAGDDLAAHEEDGLVGDAETARDVVGDDQARHAEAAARVLDEVVDGAAGEG